MALLPALLLLVLIGLAALALLLLVSGVFGGPPVDPARRVLAWRLAGLLTGGLAAYGAVQVDGLGRGLLLAAPIFGLGVLGGALLGEVTVPGPAGDIRRARLRTRRAADYFPRVLGPLVLASAGALIVVSGVTTMLAGTDDQGRVRALQCAAGESTVVDMPFPGSYYTVPTLAAVLTGLALAALVLRRIARRPQSAGPDDALRRRSAEAVVAATGLLVLVPLLGFALTAGSALHQLGPMCGRSAWNAAGWSLFAVAGLAAVLACWCAVLLLLPSRSQPGRGVLVSAASGSAGE